MKNKKAVTFSVKSILTSNKDHASREIGDPVDGEFGFGRESLGDEVDVVLQCGSARARHDRWDISRDV